MAELALTNWCSMKLKKFPIYSTTVYLDIVESNERTHMQMVANWVKGINEISALQSNYITWKELLEVPMYGEY